MPAFFQRVVELGTWSESVFRDRRKLPPRAFLNPADFKKKRQQIIAFALAAPEYPTFAPPQWQEGVIEYISEEECEKIFDYHYRELTGRQWRQFCTQYSVDFYAARRERIRHRQTKRNKRAYNYWSGYLMGMKVAFRLARLIFKEKI